MNVQLKQVFGWGEPAGVVLVSSRSQLHERLKAAFRDTNFQFTSIESSLLQASKQLRADLRRTTLIADLEGDLAAALGAIQDLRQSGFAGAIITLSETLDEASVRGLLQLNATDWLPADAPAEAIFEACRRASSARRPLDHEIRATCVSFVPAAGGVGTTTLAN